MKVMDTDTKTDSKSANLSPETVSTDVSLDAAGQVTAVERDAALSKLTLSDSDLSPPEERAPPAGFEPTVLTAPQYPGSLAQDSDNIYESDPENSAEDEFADDVPDVMDAHSESEVVLGLQQPVPFIDDRETLHPLVSNCIGQSWLTETPDGQFPKVLLDEPLRDNELMNSFGKSREKLSTSDTVPTLRKEEPHDSLDKEHNNLKQFTRLTRYTDSSVQTDRVTVDAVVNTDQDVKRYMNEVTAEREVLKDRYQEMLDRQTQMENQFQVKVRRLQQRQEEEQNIYQDNVKQVQELKVKLEELKRKSEKEKKEFVQKEQELKNEVTRLYENGKWLMKEEEEKGNLVAILISDQSDKEEKLTEDLAKLKRKHAELNKNILEQTERALKAEIQTLESKREFAIMMMDKAANEAKLHICNLSSVPGSSNLVQKWRERQKDINEQQENINNQYNGHIQMVKNGTKLGSLSHIQLPKLPPAPPAVLPDLVLQRAWQDSPKLPPFFPSTVHSTAPSHAAASYPADFPATACLRDLGAPLEFAGHSAPPTSKPATKLEKLLEKLETKFPNSTRAQLTHILQQIKNSRGTIAGLSVDELTHQVAVRLVEAEQTHPLHPFRVSADTPGHFPLATSQTNPYLAMPKSRTGAQTSYQESPAMMPSSPRLCLMCQQVVQVGEAQPMGCSHIVHRECIKFWAQSNKNSSCPFCPTPR
ncbi:RING finger protein 214-like [Scyliorhinus torazame]|uniref:RING finger protein 214-like n=1 Tax=Scyliorhinus torazame TaxID=75743 RepID=UPI003B5BC504